MDEDSGSCASDSSVSDLEFDDNDAQEMEESDDDDGAYDAGVEVVASSKKVCG